MPNQEPQYLDNRTTAGCGQMSGHQICSAKCVRQCRLLALSSSELFGCFRTFLPSLLHIAQVPVCNTTGKSNMFGGSPRTKEGT